MQLYNKLSAKERAELIEKAGDKRITLSFYKYHLISNTSLFRDYLFQMWECLGVLGRIYIAQRASMLNCLCLHKILRSLKII